LFPFRRRLTVKHSHADFTTDALARASTEELLLEMRQRIIQPRDRRRETDHWDGIGSRGELLRRL
jgi:hypothetical protein